MAVEIPKITFGIIVLNGEPFTRYCLRSIYPFAHEIIVVEGACIAAKSVAKGNGHSRDGTLETLHKFQREEDPEHKVRIIMRDGFWSEKDEQSQAYAYLATGDYLWQVDIDEFYHPEQMKAVINHLAQNPQIAMVSMKQITFWGGFDYTCDGWYLRRGAEIYNRIFRWKSGYRYASHRPPTVLDSEGRDMREIHPVLLNELDGKPFLLYHYSLVFPKQVLEKCEYYRNVNWIDSKKAMDWAQENFFELKNPFRVHNEYHYPSWLESFHGTHPPQIDALRQDIQSGKLAVELRKTDDIESVIHSPLYMPRRLLLKLFNPIDQKLSPLLHRFAYATKHPLKVLASARRKSTHYLRQLF